MSHRPAHAYHPSAELDLDSHTADEMRDAVDDAAAEDVAAHSAAAAGSLGLNTTGGSSSSLFSPPGSTASQRRGSMAVGYEDVAAQEIDYAPVDFASPASASAAAAAIATPIKTAAAPWLQPAPNGAAAISARRPNGTPHSAVRIRALSVESDSASKSVAPLAALPTAAAAAASSNDEPRFGSVGVYAALIGAQLCWSGFHLFAKVAFDYMHPMVMPMLRALGTAPIMGLICYSQDRNFWRVPLADLKRIALLGVLVCCGAQNFFNLGLMLTTAADGGITQPAVPVFAACMAIALGRERGGLLKFLGIGAAVAGTICIVVGETYLAPAAASAEDGSALTSGGGSTQTASSQAVTPTRRLAGLACFMVQCFLFAIYLLVQKPLLSRVPTATVTFYTFLFGIPGTTVIAGYFAAQMEWSQLPAIWFGAIAYTICFASIAGFMLFSYATKHLPASASSMGVTLQPFFSSILGASILGETLTFMHVVGGFFLIAGLVVVLYSRNKEALASRALAAEDARRAAATKEATQVAIAIGAASAGTEMQEPEKDALLAALHRPILQADAFDEAGAGASSSAAPLAPVAAAESPRWLLTAEPYPHRARAASVDGAFVVEASEDDPATALPMPPPVRSVSSGSNHAPDAVESPRHSMPRPAASPRGGAQGSVAAAVSPTKEKAEANPFDF